MPAKTKSTKAKKKSAWTCTYDGSTDPSDLRCNVCEKSQTSWASLKKHLVRVHAVPTGDIQGTYLSDQASGATKYKVGKELSQHEFENVGLVKGDETSFLCLTCGGKSKKKMSALAHYETQHGIDASQWLVVGDGRTLSKKKGTLRLTCAYNRFCGDHPEAADDYADVDNEDGEDQNFVDAVEEVDEPAVLPKAAPKYSAAASNRDRGALTEVMSELLQEIRSARCGDSAAEASAGKGTQVVEPTLTIVENALDWALEGNAERVNWPRNEVPLTRHDLDFEAFITYLEMVDLKGVSVDDCVQGIEMLLACFHLEGGDGSLLGFVLGAFNQGAFQQLFSLPLFRDTKSFLKKISSCIEHLVNHLLCQTHAAKDKTSIETLGSIRWNILHMLKPQVRKKRKANKRKKKQRDLVRQKNLPKVDMVKEVCLQAMLALNLLVNAYKDMAAVGLPPIVRFIANVLMAGILQFNGFCGRSMEWESLTADHARNQMKNGIEYLDLEHHKTADYYGNAGKWLFEGTWAAVAKFLELPTRGTGLFFEPPRASATIHAMHSLLRKFSKVFTPGMQVWQVTLARKFFSSSNANDDTLETSRKIVANAQQHEPDTGKDNYECGDAETSARSGRAVALAVLGDPVAWPSQEQIDEFSASTTVVDVIAWFKPRRARAGEAPAHDEDEEGNEDTSEGDAEENGEGTNQDGDPLSSLLKAPAKTSFLVKERQRLKRRASEVSAAGEPRGHGEAWPAAPAEYLVLDSEGRFRCFAGPAAPAKRAYHAESASQREAKSAAAVVTLDDMSTHDRNAIVKHSASSRKTIWTLPLSDNEKVFLVAQYRKDEAHAEGAEMPREGKIKLWLELGQKGGHVGAYHEFGIVKNFFRKFVKMIDAPDAD